MGWFLNLKTGHKLALSFGICLTLATIVGATAIARMSQMNRAAELLNTDSVAGLKGLQSITSDSKHFRVLQYRHLLETNDMEMHKIEADMNKTLAATQKDMTDYQSSAFMDEDKANATELRGRWAAYTTFQNQFLDISHRNDFKGGSKLLAGTMNDAFESFEDELGKMSVWNSNRAATLSSNVAHSYSAARAIVIGLLTVAILMGIFMASTVTKIITTSLSLVGERIDALNTITLTNLTKAVQALAAGDLTAKIVTGVKPIEIRSTDEFGTLSASVNSIISRSEETAGAFAHAQSCLNEMSDVADHIAGGDLTVDYKPRGEKDRLGIAIAGMRANLCQLISQSRDAADNISVAAGQVSVGNQDLSQRTSEQASSLEETASSMEEMTSTVKLNADNSRQANQLAAHARELAEKGGTVVGSAVSAMSEINDGSKRIAEIISVIDEIAFQTNLLALNASVEAARVGEQGRGFAVVAAEVRNLAGRSATAAKEIKSLVGDTVSKVQDGSDLVNQSGSHLQEIVGAVKKVADIIAEISAASTEQSAGIEQVNRAIMQMDQVTQQNAALVEEAAASSTSMLQLARDLQGMVGRFKLDDTVGQMTQAAKAAARPQTARAEVELAATGTDGARRPRKTAATAKSSTSLQMVSHASTESLHAHSNGKDPGNEFDEF